jgi:RNA polymerase sigma-70 factor (ECF subfamily)
LSLVAGDHCDRPATTTTAADDANDVAAAVAGDRGAFARLIARHQAAIAGYLWRFTRDAGQCEELVHDVFVEAFVSLQSYRGRGPLLHWLKRIATRVGYRFWRERSRRRVATVSLAEWDGAGQDDGAAENARAAAETVQAVLQRLPPRDRLVLTLLYLEEASVEQAAQLTGWSRTMVKVQAFRARAKLKKLLARDDLAHDAAAIGELP